ncbi:uncharacterized protein LOC134239636 [Saccostrea cucullata]|uniref:uncharacterized protein LOC134239636 n=1 Tax=Saccostrea cuccullata TaxID=36930 RepID=UPI002ED1F0DB
MGLQLPQCIGVLSVQIFFIFLCSTSSVVTLTGDKVCHRGNETSCCKDYEERNNICVECRPGFRGFDCNLTCPENHYGPRCNMPCNCNNISEYCHPVCGCISNLTKPLMIDNVTNTEHYVNITDLEQTISVESCLSSINKSMETTDKSIETKNNNFGKPADERPSIKDHTILIVFLVVMPCVLSACLLLFFGITYRKCYTRKKEEGHDDIHNALYITQEGNRENNT